MAEMAEMAEVAGMAGMAQDGMTAATAAKSGKAKAGNEKPGNEKAKGDQPPRTPMRERIIAAAIDVIGDRGIAAATTKEIARVAGVSEGSLYNHFANKNALIAATMADLAAGIREAMTELFGGMGKAPLADSLTRLAEQVVAFHRRILPVAGPVLGDPEMLAHVRRGTAEQGVGPLRGHEALAAYFAAEQAAGRVAATAQPQALAALLLGSCHQYAFLELLCGPEQVVAAGLPADAAAYARQVAEAVCAAAGVIAE